MNSDMQLRAVIAPMIIAAIGILSVQDFTALASRP